MRAAALSLIPLLACTGSPSASPVTPPPASADGVLTVVVSARVEAELEPCG